MTTTYIWPQVPIQRGERELPEQTREQYEREQIATAQIDDALQAFVEKYEQAYGAEA